MIRNFIVYLLSLASLIIVDATWLRVMAPRFYAPRLGSLMRHSPDWIAAGFFYILYALGVAVFVIQPALHYGWSFPKIALLGGLFGLVAYATYDLTNQATVQGWPVIVTVVDLIWGAVLTVLVSVCVVGLSRWWSV
ncbi:MAG: DUF2177 family protein [Patescibacteria group bacterium]|jgi:uncharacterized membrane protein